MIMPEDEIIHLIFNRIRICKSAEWFIHAFEYILFMTGKTVAAGPAVTEPEGNPWMKQTEKALGNPVVEKSTEETVSERNRAEAVSMSETEPPAANIDKMRL